MLLNICKQSNARIWTNTTRSNGLAVFNSLFSSFQKNPPKIASPYHTKFIRNSCYFSGFNVIHNRFGCLNSIIVHKIRSNPANLLRCIHISHALGSDPSKDDRKPRFTREDYQHFYRKANHKGNNDIMMYGMALVLLALAASYAAVPIYRIYCQSTGKGGKPSQSDDYLDNKLQTIQKVEDRQITVRFNADANSQMSWNFKPTQNEIKVYPGETALAFYTAKNPLDVPINGIATYSVMPFEAGQYLNKVQCFCFEEQRLNPNEEVDMPVFFYFDPEFAEDPRLENVNEVVLSYTFFEAKNAVSLPFFSNKAEVL